jgi:hypothetical protein
MTVIFAVKSCITNQFTAQTTQLWVLKYQTNLMASMPRRLQEVLDGERNPTKYCTSQVSIARNGPFLGPKPHQQQIYI